MPICLLRFAVFFNIQINRVSEICVGRTIELQCQFFSGPSKRRRKEIAGGDDVDTSSVDAEESYLRVIS